MKVEEKVKELKKVRGKIIGLKKNSDTFGEEVTINHILFAIDRAIESYGDDR
jgi:hypothetical protein